MTSLNTPRHPSMPTGEPTGEHLPERPGPVRIPRAWHVPCDSPAGDAGGQADTSINLNLAPLAERPEPGQDAGAWPITSDRNAFARIHSRHQAVTLLRILSERLGLL